MLKAYQLDRFMAFTDPDLDPRGAGYNTTQARIAIGNGGLFGQGLFGGSQTKSGFVPEQHTDFIFTVAGEELGLVGSAVLIALFAVVLWRALRIAMRADDLFGRVAAAGIACWFAFQAFQNIGMCLGIMPVTGVPLPLVSYGGSSMFAMMALGLLQNIHLRSGEGIGVARSRTAPLAVLNADPGSRHADPDPRLARMRHGRPAVHGSKLAAWTSRSCTAAPSRPGRRGCAAVEADKWDGPDAVHGLGRPRAGEPRGRRGRLDHAADARARRSPRSATRWTGTCSATTRSATGPACRRGGRRGGASGPARGARCTCPTATRTARNTSGNCPPTTSSTPGTWRPRRRGPGAGPRAGREVPAGSPSWSTSTAGPARSAARVDTRRRAQSDLLAAVGRDAGVDTAAALSAFSAAFGAATWTRSWR